MTKNKIRLILSNVLDKEYKNLDIPSESEWSALETKFSTQFSESFRYFIELMAEFSFPGDILNVPTSGKTNGNDTIVLVYDIETKHGMGKDLIPFYAIGNGDYFCLSASERKNSAIYYFDHGQYTKTKENSNFDDWVRALPEFLNG